MSQALHERNQGIVDKIIALKEKRKAVILAHNYQVPDVQELADYVGDSLELAKTSRKLEGNLIVFCGVRFMAETAKILSPHKRVLLPSATAGCPLAELITPDQLKVLKNKYPHAPVVSYVNTTAAVKALSDVCCTSSNAVTVVDNISSDTVIFVPDKNLGWWVQHNLPHKKIIRWDGFCYVHEQFSEVDVDAARGMFPEAEIMVHPECRSEVLLNVDKIVSTAGMLSHARQSQARQFVVGTEEALIYRLRKENPEKEFYSLGNARVCFNMKQTRLQELYAALVHDMQEVTLEQEIIAHARNALERMVSYV